MKVRVWSDLQDEPVGSTGLTGRSLVKQEDNAGFLCFEIRLNANTAGNKLTAAFGNEWNHIYYVLQARDLHFHCSNGDVFNAGKDSVVALPGDVTAEAKVGDGDTRLFVMYVPRGGAGSPQPQGPVHRSLSQLVGTDRDVDWQHGRSRRFLRQDDGFNISIHNTINIPGSVSPIHYKSQFEAVYWIGGRGRFTWGGDKCDQAARDWDYSEEKPSNATMMVVGNTSHIVYSYEPGPISLAVFYPPLKGTETHDFTKGTSSYE